MGRRTVFNKVISKGLHVKWHRSCDWKFRGKKTGTQMHIILMTVITVWFRETRIYEKNVGFSHDQWSSQFYNKVVYFISKDDKKEN